MPAIALVNFISKIDSTGSQLTIETLHGRGPSLVVLPKRMAREGNGESPRS